MEKELVAVFTADGFIVREGRTEEKSRFFNEALYRKFLEDRELALYQLGFSTPDPGYAPSLVFLHTVSKLFIKALTEDGDIEVSREARPISEECTLEILREVPFTLGMEHLNADWITVQWEKLRAIFAKEMTETTTTVAAYLQSKQAGLHGAGRVFFHLVEHQDETYPFAFLATYSTKVDGRLTHLPLKQALVEYSGDQEQLFLLLRTVGSVCNKSAFISELSENGELLSPLRFSKNEAYTFLKEIPLYEESGIICRIPDWWRKKYHPRVTVSIGEKEPSVLGMDTLLSFRAELFYGGLQLTREEAETLLMETAGLSFLKGKWVEVNHEKLRAALAAFDEAAEQGEISFADAVRMQLGFTTDVANPSDGVVEICQGEWLSGLGERLKKPSAQKQLTTRSNFHATLRHYQQTGLSWLSMMRSLGFGALLADDMGLGKTVQILALLHDILETETDTKTLLVIPASLIFNWQREAARFTPKLRLAVLHGNHSTPNLSEADLFITTYGMLPRSPEIRDVNWDLVILDEAQAIKNAGTKQAKAVRALKASGRIAMTGTPIENRLSDLWSLFDFLNAGLLGNHKEFSNFVKGLKNHGAGYNRLREIVNPFILRRLKTDKTVIPDLPEKQEMKTLTGLSKKQLVLYKNLIKELEAALSGAEGIARKGLVLSSIMKFKQICNHPDQFLGQAAYLPKHSGKFEKLAEICETIAEKGERVLVFTQFQEMTAPLSAFLKSIFGQEGLVLHGKTPVKKRGELVERFNGEPYCPYMVLSLKAGGVGLNLTAANHVVHFDRWWNPAVENQATDRAFRIGQRKDVFVHKFVVAGTLEEKIDQMLTNKQQLADDVIASSGETWITELPNEELLQLFRLEV